MHATLFDPATETLIEGGLELISRWQSQTGSLLWLKIDARDGESEARLLKDVFGVHPLALADVLRARHPPKTEVFEEHTFILLKELDANSSSLDFSTLQLAIFVGERFLVSRGSKRSAASEALMQDLLVGRVPPDLPRAALALRLCRQVFERYLPILLDVEDRLSEMEEELLSKPSDELLGELVRQKGALKQMLRVLEYHSQTCTYARSHSLKHLSGHPHEEQDVKEQLERHLSLARLYFELSDDLMQGYLSLSAHRLNKIMQTLTIVTVVFVPITFMAGLYGMNFEYMPELAYRPAYFALIALMVLVVVGILGIFHWRGWFGTRMQSFDKR